MGSRGSSSGVGGVWMSAANIKNGDFSTNFYFADVKGIHYFARSINGIPEEIPGGLTKKEFLNRAERNGAVVTNISRTEIKKMQEEYKKGREETDKMLNEAYARDKHFVGASRYIRKGNAAARKKR